MPKEEEQMQGYDLDDTLASVNFQQAAVKSMAAIFADAPVIYTPDSPFVVITGRPHNTDQERRATTKWLRDNQPNFKALYYVEGNQDQQIARKAAIIKRLGLTDFTDNNPDVLTALKEQTTGVRLWRMTAEGKRNPA